MTLLSSLTNRIFLACALLAVATTGVALYVVGARATREAELELQRGLEEAGALLEQQRRTLATQYLLFARLIADLPILKGAVETQDPETVRRIAEDYRLQIGADLFLVTDREGRVLSGAAPGGDPPLARSSITQALEGREVVEFQPYPGGVLHVFTVPVAIGLEFPDVLGTLSVGLLLDNRVASQFKRATRSDVAFALGGRVRAATLPPTTWPSLAALLDRQGIHDLTLDDSEFVGLARPLLLEESATPTDEDTEPVALVLQSRTERLRFLRTINTALLAATLAAMLLAIGLSYAVARTITRPLGAITDAMREIAATGDLTRKIALPGSPRWQDEDARLLAATFNSLTDSVARFQREAAQKERLLSLGRLSTVIAHEIRNPLMIIKAALRALRPNAPPDDIREAARDIDEEIARLNRTVNDVLDFARPLTLSEEPVDLGRLCRDAAAAVATANGGPRVEVRLPDQPIVTLTDPERLRTALVNILTNARQAVQARPSALGADSDAPDVAFVLERRASGRIGLRVTDRGTGIRQEDLAQIFEPYFTTRRSGTGLGLPIARNIVEALGGSLSISSSGAGTVIDIELPARPPTEAREPQSA
jgi:signal transduction histidine kinase